MIIAAVDAVHSGIDFSAIGLFTRAHWVVQAVIILLIVASFWSWAIIVDKVLRYRRLDRQISQFEDEFWSGKSLDEIYNRMDGETRTPVERVFASGMREWRRSFENGGKIIGGATHRIERSMAVTVEREATLLERWMGFLATVGSIAPFVGLFGTVWGIKNSFEAIAVSQNTNLSVVAPGIAEALFATALGLLAAIPAVVGYNLLSDRVSRLSARLEAFSDEFSTLLSRQLEKRAA